jgi:ABC-type transport system involved in multi-copper enzyme maturation permease subunit
MNVFNDLGLYLWRLLPANPILVRVVTSGGKRTRHLLARVAYLGILFFAVMIVGGTALDVSQNSLSDLAKKSTVTFMYVSIVQLFMMCFVAPVFTAAAITQERDSNTFNILLTTPLTNGQIVFGSLLSRMYFVWVLLLSGLPIFCITMLYGGVTLEEIFQSFGLAACTALITGSLAIFISVVRIGTRRTIFSFFVGIAAYLIAVAYLGLYSGMFAVAEAPLSSSVSLPSGSRMSWLAPFHPFLALFVVTGTTPAPKLEDLSGWSWPMNWMLARPQYGYMWTTVFGSIAMVISSLAFLRSGAREGELTAFMKLKGFLWRSDPAAERRRKPRHVWKNPIAWREAATRGATGNRSATRWVLVAGSVLAGLLLLIAHERAWWGLSPAAPGPTCNALILLISIEFAAVLLVVTSTAATTLTREKESQTLEMLLTTPLTSKYIIEGMLRGLVSFVMPMIAVPTATLLLFVLADLIRGSNPIVCPEAVLLVPLLILAFASTAGMIGLSRSLDCKKTATAVMHSIGLLLLALGLAYGCGMGMTSGGGGYVSSLFRPLLGFPAIDLAIDPTIAWGAALPQTAPGDVTAARVLRFIMSLISVAVWLGVTLLIRHNLVKNFDMTIRKQSA